MRFLAFSTINKCFLYPRLRSYLFMGQSPTRGISARAFVIPASVVRCLALGCLWDKDCDPLNWNVTIGTAGFATGSLQFRVRCVVNCNPIIIGWRKTKVISYTFCLLASTRFVEVKDATALNIYSINRFIRVEARLLLISLLAEMHLRWKPDLSQMLELRWAVYYYDAEEEE